MHLLILSCLTHLLDVSKLSDCARLAESHALPDTACALKAPYCAPAIRCLLPSGEVSLAPSALRVLSSQQSLKARNTWFSRRAGVESGSRGRAMISEGSWAANANRSVPSRRSAYQGEAAFANSWL